MRLYKRYFCCRYSLISQTNTLVTTWTTKHSKPTSLLSRIRHLQTQVTDYHFLFAEFSKFLKCDFIIVRKKISFCAKTQNLLYGPYCLLTITRAMILFFYGLSQVNTIQSIIAVCDLFRPSQGQHR